MKPTIEQQKILYEFYKLLHGSGFELMKKRSVMTAVLGYERWSWRVVGITEDAVCAIALNNFRKPSRQLARDHTQSRAMTYTRIFEGKVLPFRTWWEWVWEHDKTTLMTNDEHHSREVSKVYSIDPALGLFQSTGLAGWYHAKSKEGAFVKALIELHKINIGT